MQLDCESFFTALDMAHECAVGKSEFPHGPIFIDQVNDPTGIKRPKTEVPAQDRGDGAYFDWGFGRNHLDPTQIELLPAFESCNSRIKNLCSAAKLPAVVVNCE